MVAVKITVCVGSSCHVRGSRSLLTRFTSVLEDGNFDEDDVALVGSFCRERCGECMNWRFDEEEISSTSVDEAEQTLRTKLQERIDR